MTIKRAAELLSLCPKTVRNKIARGEIPVVGAGRTMRVLMPDALQALAKSASPRPSTSAPTDSIEEEAAAFVRSRSRRTIPPPSRSTTSHLFGPRAISRGCTPVT